MMMNVGGLIYLIACYYICHTAPALILLCEHGLIPVVVIHIISQFVQYPASLLDRFLPFQRLLLYYFHNVFYYKLFSILEIRDLI
jgi:hypothetical protein